MHKRDIAIAYRIFPGISKNPFFSADNKLRLAASCLSSMKVALDGVSFKIFAILDGCPDSYEELFRSHFKADDLEIIQCQKIGNQATFRKQIEILLGQTEAEIVYFAEDDYLYVPGAFEKIVKLLRQAPAIDFVTPYDHLDYYTLNFHNYKSQIISRADHHWRSVSTTCLTFAARKSELSRAHRALEHYSEGSSDASVWLSITKFHIYNPFKYLQFLFQNFYLFKILAISWKFGWRENLFLKRQTLYSPVPSLATHAEATCLAPNIDWQKHIPPRPLP
ncbi:MAG: hypothetical protein A2X86_12280 [Bdellovibrionales bacterium GWA2_49_15]|nr:MAG: hypothetical protein A2X86_12280 [Bdellovibrionales bacterium GWA2_49_15]